MSTSTLSEHEHRRLIQVAAARVRVVKKWQARARADWNRMAEVAAEEGFRPPECIHGTNLWVDYDPICPGCEEYGFNGLPNPYVQALADTRSAMRQVRERTALAVPILRLVLGYGGSAEVLRNALMDWCAEPMEALL